jgi:glycerol-3-phosphate dehydrogenase
VTSDEEETQTLMNETAAFFPVVGQQTILGRFSALRPLVYSRIKSPLASSRKEQIAWTKAGMLVVVGGKFTLFRKIAERVIDAVLKRHPRLPASKRPSLEPNLYGAPNIPIHSYIREESARADLLVSPELLEHLIRFYGTNYQKVLDCAKGDPDLLKPMTALGYPTLAEIAYCVRNEQTLHLSDFMLRRTRLAHGRYHNSLPLLRKIVKKMGAELCWNSEQMQQELQSYLSESA